jgi:hypothetical protein
MERACSDPLIQKLVKKSRARAVKEGGRNKLTLLTSSPPQKKFYLSCRMILGKEERIGKLKLY